MRCLILVVLLSCVPRVDLLCQEATADPAAFAQGYERVTRLVKREKWKEALNLLKGLLVFHQGQMYARAKHAEIEVIARRSAFRLAYAAPKPADLVTGKLQKYTAKTGQIKIKYTPYTSRDLERANELRWFPAKFTGPWTIEIKGSRYPSDSANSPIILVSMGQNDAWQITFGAPPRNVGNMQKWLPARIIRIRKNSTEDVVSKEISLGRPGKPYRLKLKVTKSAIIPFCNGKSFGQARKSKKRFGLVGFRSPTWQEVVISGRVEPSWIQSRMDAASQKNMAEFAKKYQRNKHLPDWLFENPEPAAQVSFRDRP